MADGDGRRPNHVITRDEVDAWLADSANKQVTYHRTTPDLAQRILEQGADLSRARIGSLGQGFYTATETDVFFGPVELRIAVKMRRPLAGEAGALYDFVDRLAAHLRPGNLLIDPTLAAMIRQELLRLGYDGVIAENAGGDGIDYVIAIREGTAKVVVE